MRNERSPYARIIPPSSVGAAHEMIVAADLIKRGFDVYRSVSASSRADIIIVHGARMLRVPFDFVNLLLEKAHVAFVPGAPFGSDECIRISYATSMANIEKGIDRFEKFLGI